MSTWQLHDKCEVLEKQAKQHDEVIEHLKHQVAVLKDELAKLRQDVITEERAAERRIFALEKERDHLKEQVEVLRRANEINEKQIRDYEREMADVRREPKRRRTYTPEPLVMGTR